MIPLRIALLLWLCVINAQRVAYGSVGSAFVSQPQGSAVRTVVLSPGKAAPLRVLRSLLFDQRFLPNRMQNSHNMNERHHDAAVSAI